MANKKKPGSFSDLAKNLRDRTKDVPKRTSAGRGAQGSSRAGAARVMRPGTAVARPNAKPLPKPEAGGKRYEFRGGARKDPLPAKRVLEGEVKSPANKRLPVRAMPKRGPMIEGRAMKPGSGAMVGRMGARAIGAAGFALEPTRMADGELAPGQRRGPRARPNGNNLANRPGPSRPAGRPAAAASGPKPTARPARAPVKPTARPSARPAAKAAARPAAKAPTPAATSTMKKGSTGIPYDRRFDPKEALKDIREKRKNRRNNDD